jgi:iron complex outermembrane recepter protein
MRSLRTLCRLPAMALVACPVGIAVAEEPADEIEEIVVTGSAIRRKDLNTAAPVSTLSRKDIDASGIASLGDILQTLPAHANGLNTQFNNFGEGSTRINLRGLGTSRTLVLVNGRRFVYGGSGADDSVDLNAIPAAIVERIEVLKDGASAIYGSDAISGVVNIITKKRFKGTEATAYAGTTTKPDGLRYDVSVTSGVASSKGGALFSAGYYQQNEIFSDARDWATVPYRYDWTTGKVRTGGSGNVPEGRFFVICDPSVLRCDGNQTYNNLVANYPQVTDFIRDRTTGTWRPFNPSGTSYTGEGDFYNFAPENYLLTPQQRYNAFSTGDYELSENLHGYFEASYLNRRSAQLLASEPIFTNDLPLPNPPIIVSADNIYNPFGRDFVQVWRRIVETSGRYFTQDVSTFRTVIGVDGAIPGTEKWWTYDVHFNFGRTSATSTVDGEMIISHIRNALGPSYRDANGVPRCGTPDATIADCVPLDLFDGGIPGTINHDQLAYLSYTGVNRGFNEQKILSASVSGKLFDMPSGGAVKLALGAQLDREDGAYTPDPIQVGGDNLDVSPEPTAGGYTVVSAFAELAATLLQRQTERLEVTGAIRAGRYSTSGSFVTGKVGLRWQVAPDLAFRGTTSTAFRAPNVTELYAGADTAYWPLPDPCDTSSPRTPQADAQCTKEMVPADFKDNRVDAGNPIHAVTGGYPDLQPEKALIFTGGLVFTPVLVEGFSVTLDYFWIKITDPISAFGADVTLDNCYQSDAHLDCEKVHRDPTSKSIVLIDDHNVNFGRLQTAGIDFDFGYRFALRSLGNIRARVQGTWLHGFELERGRHVVNALNNTDYGPNPSLKLNVSAQWARAGWSAAATVHFVGPYHECEGGDCQVMDARSRDVASYASLSLQASRDFRSPLGRSTFSVGILNVLDQDPPLLYGPSITASDAGTYDYLGRFFYARLIQAF